jgi:hypothetical protein
MNSSQSSRLFVNLATKRALCTLESCPTLPIASAETNFDPEFGPRPSISVRKPTKGSILRKFIQLGFRVRVTNAWQAFPVPPSADAYATRQTWSGMRPALGPALRSKATTRLWLTKLRASAQTLGNRSRCNRPAVSALAQQLKILAKLLVDNLFIATAGLSALRASKNRSHRQQSPSVCLSRHRRRGTVNCNGRAVVKNQGKIHWICADVAPPPHFVASATQPSANPAAHTAVAASLANKSRFKIGRLDFIRPTIAANSNRVAAFAVVQ